MRGGGKCKIDLTAMVGNRLTLSTHPVGTVVHSFVVLLVLRVQPAPAVTKHLLSRDMRPCLCCVGD